MTRGACHAQMNDWIYFDSPVPPPSLKFYEALKPRRQEFDTSLTRSVNGPHGTSEATLRGGQGSRS